LSLNKIAAPLHSLPYIFRRDAVKGNGTGECFCEILFSANGRISGLALAIQEEKGQNEDNKASFVHRCHLMVRSTKQDISRFWDKGNETGIYLFRNSNLLKGSYRRKDETASRKIRNIPRSLKYQCYQITSNKSNLISIRFFLLVQKILPGGSVIGIRLTYLPGTVLLPLQRRLRSLAAKAIATLLILFILHDN
jgi:hypothetical protein